MTCIAACMSASSDLRILLRQMWPRTSSSTCARIALQDHFAAVDDRHAATQLAHVFDDVRRENDDDVFADLREEIQKAMPLVGVEPRGRLVDDEEARASRERDRDAEPLLHAAGESADRFLARVPQVGLLEQRVDEIASLAGVGHALQLREMIEHALGAEVRVEAEFLRQVAENLSNVVGLGEDVDVAEADRCPSRAAAAWRSCASASTSRRRSARGGRTCRRECRARRCAGRERRWSTSWRDSRS